MHMRIVLPALSNVLADLDVGWPSAIVALALILLVGVIMGIALLKYSVDDAMKIWSGLGVLVGIMTGTFGTYFFTRQANEAKVAAIRVEKDQAIAQMTQFKPFEPAKAWELHNGKGPQMVLEIKPDPKKETAHPQ